MPGWGLEAHFDAIYCHPASLVPFCVVKYDKKRNISSKMTTLPAKVFPCNVTGPFCVVKYGVFGAGWGPGSTICRKTRCSWRLGGGLEAQFVVKYCVFGAWMGAWRHNLSLFT